MSEFLDGPELDVLLLLGLDKRSAGPMTGFCCLHRADRKKDSILLESGAGIVLLATCNI